ncbi:uncharacterized protein SEPMUDRAFT_112259 [Sphaerulina musiva SO2202]|uniref:MULE transposase domain-containing protein n=1 Tax=Sphaerulina musiva (strain SO2202) TaxID=692275 RepID=M3CUQ0_SPHMS|nr:uncharacterized protein SEPMUDRAFT_112259 [Sphaerulina musiva SO2202]EMF07892.1 hypothetical protein SEPMUDRAFT_112259 [Sphaerulina musiva SO2202]
MSFKRIYQKDLNEILFGVWDEGVNHNVPLARVLVFGETTAIYQQTFERLSRTLDSATGKPLRFRHIHQEGISAVMMDMSSKQASGLGRFLEVLAPQMDWRTHIQSTVIYCSVHFTRSIHRAVGKDYSPVIEKMQSLRSVTSQVAYTQVIADLMKHEKAEIRNWAKNKASPIIRPGINHVWSTMPLSTYRSIRGHSNSIESIGMQSYRAGQRMDLLPAIFSAAIIDQRIHTSRIIQFQTGILNRSRNDGPVALWRKRTFTQQENDPDDFINTPATEPSSSAAVDRLDSSPIKQSQRTLSTPSRKDAEKALELEERKLALEEKRERVRLMRLQNEQMERYLEESSRGSIAR